MDYTNLGNKLRLSSMDAHGRIVDVGMAYAFLLDNPELFDGADWPADMPQEPPPALIDAYYGVGVGA